MDEVVIGDADKTLAFSQPVFVGALPAEYLSVTLTGPDMQAARQVYGGWDGGFSHLAAFFHDLADQWRGWAGDRVFESIEGDLRIEAVHDGHVRLRVTLSESALPDGWRVEAHIRLDAGEDLSRAAKGVVALVRARGR